LAAMAEPEDVRPLLLHPDETAGGLMTSEYLAYPQQMRAGQVLAAIRQWPVRGHDSAYLFTVDREGRLAGAVNLFDVLRTDPQMPLSAMMDRDVLKARVDDDQEVVARLMSRYGLAAVPVVDADDRLVGVITVDDLVEVLEDEATEDIQRIAGTSPLEQPYLDAGITSMAWKRMGWLLFLFFTALLTGSVISRYEGLLSSHVILTVFLPLLIGTGGNAGSQTTATVIRALAVGDVALYDFPRVLWREMRTAIVLGVSMAALAFPAVLLWGTSPIMAGVVALSTIGIVIWANSVGSLLPLVAAKVGIDPALVSAPLMSTLVDAVGLLIYFNIAALLLRA
ncbi:MAG: magnesium transporter, partial [Anaerolineae bacterium]